MTNKDFNNLIKKLSELDSGAGQEVTMRAVKQAGVIVQSQAKLLISWCLLGVFSRFIMGIKK